MKKNLITIAKLSLLVVVTIYCFLAILLVSLVLPPFRRMKFLQRTIVRHWGKWGLWASNMDLQIIGERPDTEDNYFIVANHVSYLEAIVMPQVDRISILGRHELKYIPMIGQAAALAGILYVNRKNEESRERSKRNMRRYYERGIHITLFAEGTTTDGSDVLPFKKSVFEMGMDIVPCAIKYRTDTEFNPAWYGDQTFWPHLVELFNHKKVEGRICLFPKMSAKDFPDFTAYQQAVRDTIRAWVTAPWGEEDRVSRSQQS